MTRLITFLLWRRVVRPVAQKAYHDGFDAGMAYQKRCTEIDARCAPRLPIPSMN